MAEIYKVYRGSGRDRNHWGVEAINGGMLYEPQFTKNVAERIVELENSPKPLKGLGSYLQDVGAGGVQDLDPFAAGFGRLKNSLEVVDPTITFLRRGSMSEDRLILAFLGVLAFVSSAVSTCYVLDNRLMA